MCNGFYDQFYNLMNNSCLVKFPLNPWESRIGGQYMEAVLLSMVLELSNLLVL